jgi:methyl-accepting chemotaxis protein
MDQPNQFDLASLKESPRRQGDKQSVENQQTSNSEVIANAMSTAAPARRRSTSTRQGTTSIQFRLPFFIITLLTISLLGSTIFGSVQTNRTLTQQANERFAAQSKQVAKEVQLLLEKSVASLQTLAASEGLVEPIGELNTRYVNADGTPLTEEQILTQVQTLDEQWRNAAENDPLVAQTIAQSEDVNPLANQLYAYSEIFPENGEVFITDIYGATLAATDRLSDYYQADKDWWQATYNNGQGGIYISDIEFDESLQVSSLQISVPIIDDEEGTVVGVMRTTLDTTALQELINEQSFGQTGHAELFTATGEELIDGRSESGIGTGELPEATVQSFTLTEEGTATATDEAGGSLFFSYSRVKVTDTLPNWILLIRQDTSEALQAANQSLRNGLLITLAALAIAVVVAFFLSRSITQPLGELSEVANALAVGNLSRLSNVQSKDEFGQLSNAFNNAILELRQANARQEAEIARGQQLQNNIGEFLNVAMDIAQGDLTKRGQVSEDALGNVVDAINYMTEELGYVLRGVQDATQSVNQGATDMFSTTDSIAQSAEVQASEAQKAREDVQGIRSTMRQVSEEMTLSAESATQALRASREGQQAVVQTLEGMQDIRREVQAVSTN